MTEPPKAPAPAPAQAPTLDNRAVDYVLNAAKAAVGPIPIVGPLVSELVGVVIPNQRLDRIAKFLVELDRRIRSLEAPATILEQLSDETFTDLLEEGLRQSARSLSDERRQYIASLICNSLSSRNIAYIESRHLLRVLDQLNDIEIIWLRYYREPTVGGDDNFREAHAEILRPADAAFGAPQGDLDRMTLQKSYTQHLAQLNLLMPTYETDIETKQPEFDDWSGRQKVQGYDITNLGSLLLREIGLGQSD